jgi:SAM-dependent methyltransferase
MYNDLKAFFERPEPFSIYTVDSLWTDPHRARQMLACHLDPQSDLASRRPDAIAAIVGWLDARLDFAGKAVTDLGCGPGLYASAIARRGADVTGVDFSAVSLAHARAEAAAEGLAIAYVEADYLADPLPTAQDIVFLIYGDLCPLSPARRQRLYDKVRASLKPGGRFVFDVFSTACFAGLTETREFSHHPQGGFWAADEHFVFSQTFLYPEMRLGLDRYLIATPDAEYQVLNWMQYFDEETIRAELLAAGFTEVAAYSLLTGGSVAPDADAFMLVAER